MSHAFHKALKWTTFFSGLATALAGLAIFTGWILHIRAVIHPLGLHVPTAPSTALCFFLLGTAILVRNHFPAGHPVSRVWHWNVWAAAAIAGLALFAYLSGFEASLDHWLRASTDRYGQIPLGYMSPITAGLFILSVVSMLFLDRPGKILPSTLGILVILTAWTNIMGYVFKTPLFYGGGLIPVALPTAAAFLFLGTGLLASTGKDKWPLNILLESSTRARLLRAFLPLVLGLNVIQDCIRISLMEKLDARMVAVSLLVLLFSVLLFGLAIFLVSRGIGNSIDETKESLRASQEVLEGVLNAISVRVFWKDKNLVYLGCNAAFARDAGFSGPKDIIGKDDFQMGWRAQAELYRADDRQVIDSGTPKLLIEEVQTTPEGDILALLTNKIPLRDSQGRVSGVLGTYMDITESKRALMEKEKLQKTLAQSEKMAAVGQLAAGIAHEINNPMAVILGFAQSLSKKINPGDAPELAVKSIEREAMRCKNLVKSLLAFSRISSADQESLDLNAIVAETVPLIETQAKMKQVEIQRELKDGLPQIFGNANELQQIVVNLANNAFDAMDQGGTLTLKTELLSEKSQSWVCLKISDTGSGIAPDILPRIFEPFFTTKEVNKGTGLGLSLVYKIVEKNSGTIDVQSRPGRTEFTVKFKLQN